MGGVGWRGFAGGFRNRERFGCNMPSLNNPPDSGLVLSWAFCCKARWDRNWVGCGKDVGMLAVTWHETSHFFTHWMVKRFPHAKIPIPCAHEHRALLRFAVISSMPSNVTQRDEMGIGLDDETGSLVG